MMSLVQILINFSNPTPQVEAPTITMVGQFDLEWKFGTRHLFRKVSGLKFSCCSQFVDSDVPLAVAGQNEYKLLQTTTETIYRVALWVLL